MRETAGTNDALLAARRECTVRIFACAKIASVSAKLHLALPKDRCVVGSRRCREYLKCAPSLPRVVRRHVYTTPKSFLELLKLYNVLLAAKRDNQDAAIERLTTGLHKLRETKDAVTSLEEDLKVPTRQNLAHRSMNPYALRNM